MRLIRLKKIIYVALVVVSLFRPVLASPRDAVMAYYSNLDEKNYSDILEDFHPEDLKLFRENMGFYSSLSDDQKEQFLLSFFDKDQTFLAIAELNDIRFFSGFYQYLMQRSLSMALPNLKEIQWIGQIEEGIDIIHFLVRYPVLVGELSTEHMEIISVKRFKNEWRIMLSNQYKDFPKQLEIAFRNVTTSDSRVKDTK